MGISYRLVDHLRGFLVRTLSPSEKAALRQNLLLYPNPLDTACTNGCLKS